MGLHMLLQMGGLGNRFVLTRALNTGHSNGKVKQTLTRKMPQPPP